MPGEDSNEPGDAATKSPAVQPARPSPRAVGREAEPSNELRRNAAWAVVDSNLGDVEELANDLDSFSVYSIRADHMRCWAAKLRTALGGIRKSLREAGQHTSATRTASEPRDLVPSLTLPGASENADSATLRGNASTVISPPNPGTIAPFASGALHLLLDALANVTQAEWATCFVYSARSDELVLACSVGKRLDRPGSLRLSASSGIESHVLTTGIAVNVAHAYAEEEFDSAQDRAGIATRTKSELVFPLMKPGSTSYSFGVLQLCNKSGGTSFFDEMDEVKAGECAQFIACIIAKFPSDITNPACFDTSLLAGIPPLPREVTKAGGAYQLPADVREGRERLVFRTARAGHVRRSEVMRDAGAIAAVPTITEALAHVSKVHESWRDAVLLNIELEREIARLQESLTISKRESQRLQTTTNELKKQLEHAATSMEQMKHRRQSVQPLVPSPPGGSSM